MAGAADSQDPDRRPATDQVENDRSAAFLSLLKGASWRCRSTSSGTALIASWRCRSIGSGTVSSAIQTVRWCCSDPSMQPPREATAPLVSQFDGEAVGIGWTQPSFAAKH